MKQFKDFGIKPETQALQGDKIKITKVLNKEIIIEDYRVVNSKFSDKGNGRCLHLQVKINQNQHVVFTGSGVLMDMIEKVGKENLPITATIVQEGERFEFR